MKKVFALSLIVLGLHFGASAQSFSLGVTGGANLGKINSSSFDNGFKAGYLAGAYAQLRFGKHWGLEPEVLFMQSQVNTDQSFNQLYGSQLTSPSNFQKIHLDYLGIPVLLTYRILGIIDLEAGPQFSLLMNKDNSLLQNGQNAFKSGDVTLLAGAEVHIPRFRVYARYGWGLGNVNNISASEVSNSDTWKNESIQLGIGINIL
jgi:hypothetical protein